ncbi:MAG: AI-2E family transporter [Calditrichales bacterium]|nr:MAG: AI-2E family transporter [Calditrichales bacterium]
MLFYLNLGVGLTEQEDSGLLQHYYKILVFLLGVISVVLVGFVLIELQTIIIPLVVAAILSLIFDPMIAFFEKRRIPEAISILIVITISFLVFFVIGQLINLNVRAFVANSTQYEERFKMVIKGVLEVFSVASAQAKSDGVGLSNTYPTISAIIDGLSIKSIVTATLKSVSSIVSNIFLVMIYLLFLLVGRNSLVNKLDIAFDKSTAGKMRSIALAIKKQINKYVITKTLISLLTGGLVGITLWLFGLEFAFIWGLLTFMLNFIPNIGSFIATFFPLAFALVQFDSYLTVGWVAIVLFAIQFVIGSVLEPKIVGNSMDISPVVVLFSLIFWGYAWGIIGMILAVPFAVLLKIIFENISGLKPIGILMSSGSKIQK